MKKIILFSLLTCIYGGLYGQTILQESTMQLPNGVNLKYVECGDTAGIPVVFLHGYTDSWRSFEKLIGLLPESFHILAVTQRGHGNSDKPPAGYSLMDFAGDLALFIKEKKLPRAVIAGHSLGGMIAQKFVLQYPELSRGLIIMSSDAAFHDNPGLPEFAEAIYSISSAVEKSFASEFQYGTLHRPVDSSEMEIYINESMKMPPGIWKQVCRSFMSEDLTDELHHVQVPVLAIWGNKDEITGYTDQQAFISRIPGASLLVYENTGHAIHWEDPARVAMDITQFIADTERKNWSANQQFINH